MYIVTGGAGQIGSACVWALNQRGIEDICIVDRLGKSDKWKNLRGLKYTDYYEKDSFLKVLYEGGFDNVDAIIHMGACSSVYEDDMTYLLKNNIEYSQHLAFWALERGVRFIYASSGLTYGKGAKGFNDDVNSLDELRPLFAQAYSKHYFDQWVSRQGIIDRVCGLKFAKVYGPNEDHKGDEASMIRRTFNEILATGTATLYKSEVEGVADGDQAHDFIYIKDVANIINFLLDNREVNGIFNVGSGSSRTCNDVVSAIFSALNRKPSIEYVDMPEKLKKHRQFSTECNIGKLQAAGFHDAPMTVESGVKDYVINYLLSDDHLADV